MPRIVLIDDDPLQLRILGRQLQNLGLSDVQGFDDAALALQVLDQSADVALVCCDLQMPGLDGRAVVEALGARRYAGGFLLISGDAPELLQAVEVRARALGLDWLGALSKPVAPARLRERLEALLTR